MTVPTAHHRPSRPGLPYSLRLTETETRVLAELAAGSTLDLAARRLEISSRTVRRRIRGVCDRLDVNTPVEAIVWAVKRGLI